MRVRLILLAAAVALLPAAALGQITKLYAADSDSGRVWGFAGPASYVINHDHPFSGIEDMGIASDGRILVAHSAGSLSAVDPYTGEVEDLVTRAGPLELYPDGETGDLFFVKGDSTLWVIPVGEEAADSCMVFPGHVLDLLVSPSGPRKGHLIVLMGVREDTLLPYVAEFERTGPTTFNELSPVVEEATENAIDLAFRPDGALVLLDGVNGLYNVGPDGGLAHFGPPHVGAGSDDLDIGSDGTIYIANTPTCGIYRVSLFGQVITPSLSLSYGCPTALVAHGFTATPPGVGVQVSPAEDLAIMLESVADGGYTSAVLTESASRTSPAGKALPGYAALPDGETEFTYVSLSTTASYEDLVQTDVLLPGTRLFACSADTQTIFQDVTVEGSIEDARGVISRFDEIVLVQDLRPLGDVVDHKFDRLYEILEPVAGEPPDLAAVKAELDTHADEALAYCASYLYQWAIDELAVMNGVIRSHAGGSIPNSPDGPMGNLAGEMLSRSKTLMWSLSFLEPPTGVATPEGNAGADSYSLAFASPARGECRFELSGPAGARVVATLCTSGGRLVKTLYDGAFSGGRLTLAWDGTDKEGRHVASGVYMTRVESGTALATGKVVFIR